MAGRSGLSKAGIEREFEALGRWPEFVVERERLRKSGVEAWQAWRQARENLLQGPSESKDDPSIVPVAPRPADAKPDALPLISEAELDRLSELGPADFARDFQWASDHIKALKVRPGEAPSGQAWFILEWGRENPQKFVELAMKCHQAAKSETPEEKVWADDRRKTMAVLDQFRESAA